MSDIRRATTVDEIVAAEHLLDEPARPEWAQRFLGEPGHHLLLAYADGKPVGMISGVEMTHPDKGTEMFLYELGVDDAYRRKGIATELINELSALAKSAGCYGMWVPVDSDNEVALATYRSIGRGIEEGETVVLSWKFD